MPCEEVPRDGEAQALVIVQETSDQFWESKTEGALGDTYRELRRFEDAVEHYQRARTALLDTAPQHADQADVLLGLGSALDSLGRTSEAREAWLAAIPIFDRLASPRAAELRDRFSGSGREPDAPLVAGEADRPGSRTAS